MLSKYKWWLNNNSGWLIIGVLCAIPVIRWAQLTDVSQVMGSWYGIATTIAKVGALIGTMLYALNFVLAVRHKWLEPLFGGLNRVYIAHHVTGGIALILLCIHPLFIMLRHIEFGVASSYRVAAQSVLPDAVRLSSIYDFTESMAINFGIIGFLGLVVLLICTFFIKLPYRVWLLTHRFLGLAFLVAGLHIVYVWSDVRNDLPLRLYLVFWIGIGLAAFVHRTLLSSIFVRRYSYTVSRAVSPAEGVLMICFEPQRKRVSFKAGQFVFITFTRGELKGETHPFSMTGKQGDHDKELEIHVKALGDFTTRMQTVKVGDKVMIEGAFGRFIPALYPGTKQVWIAGGIGITPFIAMSKALGSNNAKKITLFYSVNKPSEMIHKDMFTRLFKVDERFHFEQFLAGGEHGFLTASYIAKVTGGLDDTVFFICGPPGMMKAVKSQLLGLGVSRRCIISEEFSLH